MTKEFRRSTEQNVTPENDAAEESDAEEEQSAPSDAEEATPTPCDAEEQDESQDVANAPEIVEVDHQEVTLLLRLTHALCYYSVQGRTLAGKQLALLDTESAHFSRRALIVGLSRAVSGDDIQVFSRAQDNSRQGMVQIRNGGGGKSSQTQVIKALFCSKRKRGALDVWYDCDACVKEGKAVMPQDGRYFLGDCCRCCGGLAS